MLPYLTHICLICPTIIIASGKPKVVLTSDSPALNGSSVSFTAKLQYPPCQKEANGQVRSGYVYNWTSWLEDYGYGRCADPKKCNVFPDGKPFPQSNDWRHKNYVYVWHTRGQYYETCDGSSSSLSLNTSALPLGAEVMEVLVYRQRERRKYSPLTTDSTVYHITDKIPVIVKMSQKSAANMSDGVFFRGEEVLFQVLLHDPSEYLKMAFSVDYLWDFRDGNQLVTHREVITHTYSTAGRRSVSLVVEAAFPIECPPAAETSTLHMPSAGPTHHTALPPTVTPSPEGPSTTGPWLHRHPANANQCFRYVHGSFTANISVIGVSLAKSSLPHMSLSLHSAPTSACTIVSDPSCSEVQSILCDDLPPSPQCLVHLRRSFSKPGTYCVNITLEDSHSVALASTKVSISKAQEPAGVHTSPRPLGNNVMVTSPKHDYVSHISNASESSWRWLGQKMFLMGCKAGDKANLIKSVR
uniref:Glycoprotein (transmembrane) nmb n=1 Tax=Neogobius melanostomus TaxID=47308 RepID=A0A8C6UBB6_9GOBI